MLQVSHLQERDFRKEKYIHIYKGEAICRSTLHSTNSKQVVILIRPDGISTPTVPFSETYLLQHYSWYTESFWNEWYEFSLSFQKDSVAQSALPFHIFLSNNLQRNNAKTGHSLRQELKIKKSALSLGGNYRIGLWIPTQGSLMCHSRSRPTQKIT